MSSTTAGRKETERTKLIQEKCQSLLTQMLRDEDNKYCVDCDAKGPRWASWNLGVFLCIRCAGIHRNLGVHISRVKSVNLDSWTPEQVISLQQMGNSRARAVYEAQLPDGFRRPQIDTALESFIRAKYEHKKYLAREWVPPSPPKVDWAKEIDEELERQKRKKKAAQANNALGIGILSGTLASDKKISASPTASAAKNVPLPAPLPKPKVNQISSSPKATQRTSISSTGGESDLLGLSSPTKPINATNATDLNNDSFSSFLSATTSTVTRNTNGKTNEPPSGIAANSTQNSLVQEEQDFFNQGSLGLSNNNEKDKSGKLTKDSILALYGAQSSHNPQINFGGFTGMAPGFMQHQQPTQQQQMFMTPPNSASMYNAPVMTAPNAFSAPTGFGAQFPPTNAVFTGGLSGLTGMTSNPAGIMSTGQQVSHTQATAGNINLMQTNQSLLSGMPIFGTQMTVTPTLQQSGGGMHIPVSSFSGITSTVGVNAFPTQGSAQATGAASTTNLNQQFGNLNIGNVWQ